ncbi:MAG: HAMP domain-containing histidine kinase [Candidatus Pristimantibacillus lignocellulolyticus]|uniref:histidine kinase n=1 Tax=Candidatus Pristimantibacillus lignocellulolyticus TaxID=2994561 RepID=A0A9J6ZKN9_9BACL|nr:MAG: HAMP domain-containing histidine kinase [Candidatus Pristimantibacillus lignocellulolyticus]
MLRNKEFSIFIMGSIVATLILLAIAYIISWEAFIMVASTAIILGIIFVIYTRWRYGEIEKLSSFLREISSGNYGLDVRNNREGELSILRNEIFKVTERLSHNSEFLKRDKIRMADAIADISHQLKTPLTSMQVMLDLLDQPTLPRDKHEEFLRSLQLQLERMDWLITSLLKLSKLDAGTIDFSREQVKVSSLIKHAMEPIAIPLELKELQVELHGDLEAVFHVDRKWTTEALINILKNAVEHTPANGRIDISILDTYLYTEVSIADSGVGVAKEDLPHLFKRFYKGKHSGESSIGIGLALSYSILQAQNGIIEVQNGSRIGTVFTLKWYKVEKSTS